MVLERLRELGDARSRARSLADRQQRQQECSHSSIHSHLSQCSDLRYMNAANNFLSERIRCQLGLVPLWYLVLANNTLVSAIPSELAQLSGLIGLDLSNTSLTGSIPQELSGLVLDGNLSSVSLLRNHSSQNSSQRGYVPWKTTHATTSI